MDDDDDNIDKILNMRMRHFIYMLIIMTLDICLQLEFIGVNKV